MSKKNRESVSPWMSRLFKQSGVSIPKPMGKTYFAHRYHDPPTLLEASPFDTLFSGLNGEPKNRESGNARAQRFFVGGLSDSIAHPLVSESVQPDDINPVQTSVRSSDLSGNAEFTVLHCYDETPDTKTFRLGRFDKWHFDYLPGQYITLSTVIRGLKYTRSYSLASSPSRPNFLEITVKRAPNGGIVSNWLNDNLKIGDLVKVKGPFGKFTCLPHTHQKILFIAAGSGIVPIMSMLRWLTDTNALVDVRVLLSFRTPEDVIYRDELHLIAARHQNIKMAITLTTDSIARYSWSGLMGRVNETMIDDLAPDLPERMVYLCGPDAFMAQCKSILLKLNLPAGKVLSESFSVNHTFARPGEAGMGPSSVNKAGLYRIVFARSGKTIAACGWVTLLALAEQSGVAIRHECRSGSCGECMIKCLKGKVDMTEQAEIDAIDRAKGWVFACCAYPSSDVVLDI